MPKLDCAFITPWVAADPGNPDPALQANRPQLTDDYRHETSVAVSLIDEIPDIAAAVAAAESHGPGFRSQLHNMAANGATGYGIRVPQHIWEAIKATAEDFNMRPNPLFMGPALDPAETDFEIYQLVLTVIQEGVRLFEDKTGQPSANIVPTPNQYTVRAIVDESVLINIKADGTYFYMTGVTMPDDPLDPGATPPSPHEKPPEVEMSAADEAEYRAWQEAQGWSTSFLASMKNQAKTIRADEVMTYGAATIETAAVQHYLEPAGGEVLPDEMTVARFLARIYRGLVADDQLSPLMKRLIEELRQEERERQLRMR